MKKSGKIALIASLFILMLLCFCSYANAEKKTTGMKKGQVLMTAYSTSSKSNATLVPIQTTVGMFKVQDVYESEKYKSEVFVQYAPGSNWTNLSETNGYTLSQSVTVSGSGNISVDILKKFGLKASYTISTSKGTSGATSIKPTKPSKKTNYTKCRPVIKSDYYEITFYRCFYYGNKCVNKYNMTARIPVQNTGLLCYQYK